MIYFEFYLQKLCRYQMFFYPAIHCVSVFVRSDTASTFLFFASASITKNVACNAVIDLNFQYNIHIGNVIIKLQFANMFRQLIFRLITCSPFFEWAQYQITLSFFQHYKNAIYFLVSNMVRTEDAIVKSSKLFTFTSNLFIKLSTKLC